MIQAYLTHDTKADTYQLELKGHAAKEKDNVPDRIVCAAVSTLAYTCAQNLSIAFPESKDAYKYKIRDGYANITAKAAGNPNVANIFGYTLNGILLLAHNYPELIEAKRLDI